MQSPPPYVGHTRPQVWRAMVRHYTSAAYKRKHAEQKLRRAEMGGGSHTQGSVALGIVQDKKVRKCIALTLIIMFFLIPQMRSCIFVLSFAGQGDRLDCIAVQDMGRQPQEEGQERRDDEVGERDRRSQGQGVPGQVCADSRPRGGPRHRAI